VLVDHHAHWLLRELLETHSRFEAGLPCRPPIQPPRVTNSMGPRSISHVQHLLGQRAVVFGTDMPIFNAARACTGWNTAQRMHVPEAAPG
jgi:hypothetical protein